MANVGQKLAQRIVWSHIYNPSKKQSKNEVKPLTEEEVKCITTKGTLADMCGALHDALFQVEKGSIHERNLALLYNLSYALKVWEVKNNDKWDEFYYDQCVRSLSTYDIVSRRDARVGENVMDEDVVARVCDDIFIDLLPGDVETIASQMAKETH